MTVTTAASLLVDFMPGAGPFDLAGDYYLSINGASASNATTPDHANLDITGDIEVRVDATLDSWTTPTGTGMELFGKFAPPSNQSWLLWINSNRRLVFRHSTDGTAIVDNVCPLALPVTTGRLAVRVILDVDNGSGNHSAFFYTGPTIDGPWSLLSGTLTAGTTSIFNSTATVGVGNVPSSGFNAPSGRIHAARIYAGTGSTDVRANPNFTAQAPGTTSFADTAPTPKTWTVGAAAEIAGFDWASLTNRLIGETRWSIGRDDELSPFPPGTADLEFKNEDRELDPEYADGTWYGKLNPRTPVRIRSITSSLDLPGSAGATASTPDHASLAVTDLDVRVRMSMDDWTPGGFGQFVVGQWPNSAGNNGWILSIAATGEPVLTWTANGTTQLARTCSVPTGFSDGSMHWLRATLDVNNGAAGHTVVWYTSEDAVTWTQLGATSITAGTTSIFNSTATLAVGDILSLNGQVKQLEVRDGIGGTIAANPDFMAQRPGTTSFKDCTGKTWTVNGTATIASDTAHTQDEFFGFVEDGFKQIYSGQKVAECQLRLVDMLAVLNDSPLPDSAYVAEVLADRPKAFWQLDETSGTQMADSSGNGRHGRYDNSVLGEEALIHDDGRAVQFPHVGDNRGEWKGQGLPTAPPVTLEAWIQTPRDPLAIKTIIGAQRDNSLGSLLWLQIAPAVSGSPNGELVIDFYGLGSFYKARGHTRVDDNKPHHVVCTINGTLASDVALYVDGVAQTKTTVSGTNPGVWASHLIWTIGNTTNNGSGDYGLDGIEDAAAIYDYALTAEQVRSHYDAGVDAFSNEASGTRISRILDIIGHPSSLRDIATGNTFVGPAAYGQNAGATINNVVESEQGTFHVDHRHGGKLKFRGRYARILDTRSATSLVTFTDADATGNLHYERSDLDVDPNSIGSVVNVVNVGWRGGTITVEDTESRKRYGPQSRSIRTDAPTAEVGASAGRWMTNRYGQPQARVRGFKLRPDADRQLLPAALALELSDRHTVERHPQQLGDPISNELMVERISHNVGNGSHWLTTVRTSAASTGQVWRWGLSTWGETTVWG